MDKEHVKAQLASSMRECNRAMLRSIEGSDAEYAAYLGKTLQKAYLNIDSYPDHELKNIFMNAMDIQSKATRIAA